MRKLLLVVLTVLSFNAYAGDAWNFNRGVNASTCAVGSPGAWTQIVQVTITKQLAANSSYVFVEIGGFMRYVKAFQTGRYKLAIFRDGASVWTSTDPTGNNFELILDDLQGKPDMFWKRFQDDGSLSLTGQHTYAFKVQMQVDAQCISWDNVYMRVEEVSTGDRHP